MLPFFVAILFGILVSIITLDFETYYDKGLGFKTQTTEEYIRDPRFEVIGVGVKVDESAAEWFSGTRDEIFSYLKKFDWKNSALLCHNTMFDGAVLNWFFKISPALYLDTLCMARAIHGVEAGGSLASLSSRYEIGQKGTEVEDAYGKRRLDFSAEELERYGQYCKNDVELTYKLYQILSKDFPSNEIKLIDMTLRMFTHPVLEVDNSMLIDRLDELREEKQQLLSSLMSRLNVTAPEDVRAVLASNKKFGELLVEHGVEPPMKESKTTGKQTLALAKNDEGFIALMEHENTFIQELCAVRLGTKSTLEESRIERFIDIGKRNKGRLPIPLKYYGAHTGRWSGSDKVNFQNLPSRDKKKKTLKNAVVAPEGYKVINCDSSQIEARVLAWLSGQTDLVEEFKNGDDVYSIFASDIYERPITKENPVERFVGKTCILGLGYGTGAIKLQHTLKTTPPSVSLDEDECKRIVKLYREKNDKIIELWGDCDDALDDLAKWTRKGDFFYLGQHSCVRVSPSGIILPNDLMIRYPGLALDNSKYTYQSRKGEVSIWGGSVVENVVQALARIIVGEQMIKLNERYRPVLTVHDAAVCIIPEDEVDEATEFIINVMSEPPAWAVGLPVACEAKVASSYGEC
jgi:DNA polymerase